MPARTATSFKCSAKLLPIQRPRIRVVTWVIGKTWANCSTVSGTTSNGTNTPERKSIRKSRMKPTLSALRTFGITLASTSPKAKKLKLLKTKATLLALCGFSRARCMAKCSHRSLYHATHGNSILAISS